MIEKPSKEVKNPLLNKLIKAGGGTVVSKSRFFDEKRGFINTGIPALNIALSGEVDGGLSSGLTVIAGPSRTFKSCMSLKVVAAFLNKYGDGVCLFYDSEFGTTNEYMREMGVDTDRVIHIPVTNVEQLKFDIVEKIYEIEESDNVIILMDSIGNIASKKEVEDAVNEKSVADMTRAKAIRSLFRIITPELVMRGIPCIAIGHVYEEIGMFPKTIIGGGTSLMYSCNTAIIISRSQEKDGAELIGYNFNMVIEKSRFVKEKRRIPLTVRYDESIDETSGMMDMMKNGGFIISTGGWYATKDEPDTKFRQKDAGDRIRKIAASEEFKEYVRRTYKLGKKEQEAVEEEQIAEMESEVE